MNIEKVHNGIRYTLTNENLSNGDKVFPIGKGRCLDNGGWILHNLDFRNFMSGFPNEPHTILDIKHGKNYKPYEVHTDFGYSPIESYFKVIKKEHQVKLDNNKLFNTYEWVELK